MSKGVIGVIVMRMWFTYGAYRVHTWGVNGAQISVVKVPKQCEHHVD